MRSAPLTRKRGFTLIEIMIVVTIIAIMAAMSVPLFEKIQTNSQNARLVNDLRLFANMVDTYAMENGQYPTSSSDISDGDGYVNSSHWANTPPIGGAWVLTAYSGSVISAIGVQGYNADDDQLQKFDSKYDDGGLGTGLYRKLSGGYYRVIAE